MAVTSHEFHQVKFHFNSYKVQIYIIFISVQKYQEVIFFFVNITQLCLRVCSVGKTVKKSSNGCIIHPFSGEKTAGMKEPDPDTVVCFVQMMVDLLREMDDGIFSSDPLMTSNLQWAQGGATVDQ